MKPVRIGCSGWVYADWRGSFYPAKLPQREWLRAYAERFDTVEVNNTFYRLPALSAVEGWVEATPSAFTFAVKGSRYLTHMKRLKDLGQGLDRFYERIEPLVASGKLGPVLWQLPASFHRDDERLRAALQVLAERPGRHAFEFRHPTWFDSRVHALLREHRVPLVVADDARRPLGPGSEEITADWTYVRLHYGHRGRRGNYSDAELREWAARIASWRERVEAFVYLNNDWEAFAPRNALRLGELLG